jgi:zinc transport system substrate-binding protein
VTRLFFAVAFFSAFLFLVRPVMSAEQLLVYVSILPQQYIVQQIGKDRLDVCVMIPPGADVHTYEPKPKQMVDISKAKLYFAVGIEFEKRWMKKIAAANKTLRVVHTDQGIDKIPMKGVYPHDEAWASDKDDEHGKDHHHEGLDPHIWLSPTMVMRQARAVLYALQEADPDHRSDYERHYNLFMKELVGLDAELKNIFAGKQGLRFMVFHPAWGYFAHAYGLIQVPVEVEGREPKASQLVDLIDYAKKQGIKVIFAQPQFSPKSAKQIAKEIGGEVVFADPLAPNWSENLRAVAKALTHALR